MHVEIPAVPMFYQTTNITTMPMLACGERKLGSGGMT
jgi:hypothetical protein